MKWLDRYLEREYERKRADETRATIHMWDAHREILEEPVVPEWRPFSFISELSSPRRSSNG